MRKLFKNLSKTGSIFLIASLSLCAWAKGPVVRVDSIVGNAFVFSNGKTEQLKPGSHLYDFTEIMTEVGSQVTFSDFYNHKFHLSGSGHVALMNKMIELKRGYLWLQSFHPEEQHFSIQTANAVVTYSSGESIVSFDTTLGKSQILVIKGSFEFAHHLEKHLKETVREGEFSFIHRDYERGAPRRPTPIGYNSFQKVTALFQGVKPQDKKESEAIFSSYTQTSRIPASVETPGYHMPETKDAGKIIIIRKERMPSSENEKALLETYKNKLLQGPGSKKKFKPSYDKKSNVPLRVFGQHSDRKPASKAKTEKSRMPASIGLNPQVEIKSNAFENTLTKEYKKQMRHDEEVNQLINDLKSYDQDYKTAY